MVKRCDWPKIDLAIEYHDKEWGVPVHDDQKHFEFLILDAFQAGLSWDTILKKRENFRQAFDNFDPARIACYTEQKIASLLEDAGIVRNRAKVRAAVRNAEAFLSVQEEFGSFDAYIWNFVEGKPVLTRRKSLSDIPATTPISDRMSKALKQRGFNFVGSTICYAYMQAAGLVNDHLVSCFRYKEVGK